MIANQRSHWAKRLEEDTGSMSQYAAVRKKWELSLGSIL